MAKDPAVLFYIDRWIAATNGMKADFRAWYNDLLLYQYDRGGIPNDIDEIAGICRVRPSEYELFKLFVEQVLRKKFKQMEDGKWHNDVATEILKKREAFLDKRAKSGTIGYIIKCVKSYSDFNINHLDGLKTYLITLSESELSELKDEQVLKQMLKQKEKLYINVDVIVNKGLNKNKKESKVKTFELPVDVSDELRKKWTEWKNFKKEQFNFDYKPIGEKAAFEELIEISKGNQMEAAFIIQQSINKTWKGLFQIKKDNGTQQQQTGNKTASERANDLYNDINRAAATLLPPIAGE